MDLIVLFALMAIVVFFFKKFYSFVYFIGIVDIFLRIVTFIKVQLLTGDIYNILNKYIPSSIPSIIKNYSSGFLYTLLLWAYVVFMIIFEFYVIRTFLRRKR